MFDQRGCGKSTPHASLDENNTWRLIEDMEKIRSELGITSWQVPCALDPPVPAIDWMQLTDGSIGVWRLLGLDTLTSLCRDTSVKSGQLSFEGHLYAQKAGAEVVLPGRGSASPTVIHAVLGLPIWDQYKASV